MDQQHAVQPQSQSSADRTSTEELQNPSCAPLCLFSAESTATRRSPTVQAVFCDKLGDTCESLRAASASSKSVFCLRRGADSVALVRIFFSFTSESMRDLSLSKDRQKVPATTLPHKSRSSQAAILPEEHQMFMKEGYTISFTLLRDLNESEPLHLKYVTKKIKNMANGSPNLVLETMQQRMKEDWARRDKDVLPTVSMSNSSAIVQEEPASAKAIVNLNSTSSGPGLDLSPQSWREAVSREVVKAERHAFQLWRALGAEPPLSRSVLHTLLAWLQERPLPTAAGDRSPQLKDKAYLHSLAAMNTLHELQFTRKFKSAVREAYPRLLLALLCQVLYILELELPGEPIKPLERGSQDPGQQPHPKAQETPTPSPKSTSLEALKSLLSTTGHWHDFTHLELQAAWGLFSSIPTYPQGVSLLARAMVQNRCQQVKAVLGQLLPSLQSREERKRKVVIFILIEFLYSPTLLGVLPKQAVLTALGQSLQDPSPEVHVWSLQGLGNALFHPKKVSLLHRQLPGFLAGLFQDSEPVVMCVMATLSDMLHCLGALGVGAHSISVAVNAHSFFDDERDGIWAAAMGLFGDLMATMEGSELGGLQAQVHQSMVPLLLHLKDHCPAVVTQAKFTFYRCARLLRWRLQHTLFCTLAREQGLSARHFLWTCLMAHSQEFNIHLAQALNYLQSHHPIRTWAALFIGYAICYHPQTVFHVVSGVDTNLLFCTFENLKKDPEPIIREFAARQLSFLQRVAARPQH
ncbi:maestro heat-like repeat family member 5 [Rhynchocyon petersi]